MITKAEKLAWVFVLLFVAWGANKVYAAEIYNCKGASGLIYDYNVTGITLTDLDTGTHYNIFFCFPVNAERIKWEAP